MANTTIDQLTALNSANITDRTKVHFLIDDTQSTPATKQLLLSELDDLWATDTQQWRVYSASHGLTSGDYGKPVGWKSDGKPYVWNDAAATHEPVAILTNVPDANHVVVSPFGQIVEVAQSLLPTPSSGDKLFWDSSADAYTAVTHGDALLDVQVLYYIGAKEGDATTAVCIVLPWQAKNGTVANIVDFGAVADGSTVNTTAIQNAINSGRPLVYVPGASDSYVIDAAVSITTDYQTIYGDGPASCIEQKTSDVNAIQVSGSSVSNRVAGVTVRSLWVKGPGENFTPSTPRSGGAQGNGIRVYYAYNCLVENCIVSHCAGDQIRAYGCSGIRIYDNWCLECYNPNTFGGTWQSEKYADILIDDYNENFDIQRNHCHSNCLLNISIAGAELGSGSVIGNTCFSCTTEGVPRSSKNGRADENWQTYNNVQHNILVQYGDTLNFGSDGKFILADNLFSNGRWTNLYCHVSGASSDQYENNGFRITATGNIFHGGGWYNDASYLSSTMTGGVSFLGSFREVTFAGNSVLDYKGTPYTRAALQVYGFCQGGMVNITGNMFSHSFGPAIALYGEAALVNASGNYIYNCGGRGLYSVEINQTASAQAAVAVSSINTSTNVFTATSHGFDTTNDDNIRVRFTCTSSFFTAAGMLVNAEKVFYMTVVDANTFTVSETPGGSAIDVLDTFSGSLYVVPQKYVGSHKISGNMVLPYMEQLTSEPVYFADSCINTSTETITMPDSHGLTDGDYIIFGTTDAIFQIGGTDVLTGTIYTAQNCVIDTGSYPQSNTFQVYDVTGVTQQNLSSTGTGPHWFKILRGYGSTDYFGGVRLSLTDDTGPTVISDNFISGGVAYESTYPAYSKGLVIVDTSGNLIIRGNLIDNFNHGLAITDSTTARRVDEFHVSENTITRCLIPFLAAGTVNGLVLLDESNVIDPGSTYRVYHTNGYVGYQGRRQGANVIIGVTVVPDRTLTFTLNQTTIDCTSHGYTSGDRIQLTGSPPSPFTTATNYWVTSLTSSTLNLASTRGGSAIQAGANGSATSQHHLPAFGTYVVADKFENKSWASSSDWVDQFCTTAGAIGTCVFTKRYMTT